MGRRGPGERDADLHDGAQFRDLRMLKEVRADSKLSTDSHEAWPKAEPSHVPLNEETRKMSGYSNFHRAWTQQGAGRSRRKGSCVSSGGLRKQDATG